MAAALALTYDHILATNTDKASLLANLAKSTSEDNHICATITLDDSVDLSTAHKIWKEATNVVVKSDDGTIIGNGNVEAIEWNLAENEVIVDLDLYKDDLALLEKQILQKPVWLNPITKSSWRDKFTFFSEGNISRILKQNSPQAVIIKSLIYKDKEGPEPTCILDESKLIDLIKEQALEDQKLSIAGFCFGPHPFLLQRAPAGSGKTQVLGMDYCSDHK